jgi:putative transposase
MANTVGVPEGQVRDTNSPGISREDEELHGISLLGIGYCVSTVGLDEAVIRDYIRNQEEEEKRQEQQNLKGL